MIGGLACIVVVAIRYHWNTGVQHMQSIARALYPPDHTGATVVGESWNLRAYPHTTNIPELLVPLDLFLHDSPISGSC